MLCSTLLWKEELSFTKGLPFKSMQSKANKHTFTFIHLQFQIHWSWHQHDISHWDTLAPSGGLDVLDIDVLTASCRQHLGAKGVDCQRKPICWNLCQKSAAYQPIKLPFQYLLRQYWLFYTHLSTIWHHGYSIDSMKAGAWNGKIFLFTWSYATNSLSMMQLSTSWAKVSLTTCAMKVT